LWRDSVKIVPALVLLALSPAALLAQAPAGVEFQVNAYTTGVQGEATVASNANGDFVVVWASPDGGTYGVFGQRFSASGVRQASEFRINSYTTNTQDFPSVGSDANGNFLVVWQSFNQDGNSSGIFGQRFDRAGAPMGSEFRVNSYTTDSQGFPSVALHANGSVVVWSSNTQDGSAGGVFGRQFSASGVPQASEFRVNSYTTSHQVQPAVASDESGNFVVVWRSATQDGSSYGIFGQRFDASGAPVGPEFQANTYTTGTQGYPDVAVDAAGNFVVVWAGAYNNQDGDADGVFGQEFTGAGVPDGPEFQVNTYTTGYQNGPVVAAGPGGTFVVAWQSGQDGSFQGIVAQRFRAVGPLRVLLGSKLRLEDDTDTTRRRLLVRSVDPSITLGGGNGSSDDPTVSGGRLRVQSATFKQTYDLPAANWKTIGPPGANRGYVYQDPFLFAGPVAAVKVRAGQRLRVWAKGSQLGQTLASNPYPVRVILQTGDLGHRYCMTFGGVASFKPGRLFLAHGAPAACP
jgi:hypothetical protein